jgi:DNA helicase-2/ATP-dependent DNA helicase PcrA
MIQETADTSGKIPTKAEVMQKLKEKWHWTTFQNATSEGQFYERAKNMTENYLEWRKNNKNKFIASEFGTKFEYKGLTLNGKIDWIEENPNGELEVVDFKTGKSVTSQNKANVDWQLHIYAWLIEHDPKFGKLPVKASLYFLEKNKMVSIDIDKKKVEELLEYEVQPLIERILKNDFKADPESYKCSQCEYRNICDYSLG